MLHQNLCVLFHSQSFFVEEVLPTMVKKNMDHHVLLNLAFITIVFVNFDLWMSCNSVDNFALIINSMNDIWCHACYCWVV
jgi:hypothetical protein